MSVGKASLIGSTAIMMWSLLALLTIGSAPVPPLLLNAICFGIAGSVGLFWMLWYGFGQLRNVGWKVYAFGTAGLFGYHFLFFTAFRLSPTAETGLIAYLWPLLIVLFSGLLPGERLRAVHLVGSILAFAGAAIIALGNSSAGETTTTGLVLAFLCAVTWATYSIVSRRLGSVPTESVAVFCLATALLSLIAHLLTEQTVWPTSSVGWISILALGLGPVGVAFFTWDIGMKKGNIQILGVASYAAPVLSTLALVAFGYAEPSWSLAVASVLVAGGAAIASSSSSDDNTIVSAQARRP